MTPDLLAIITAISTGGDTSETVALAQAILALQPSAPAVVAPVSTDAPSTPTA